MPFNRTISTLLLTITLSCSALLSQKVVATESIERAGDLVQIALPLTAWGVSYFSDDDEGFYQFTKSFAVTMVATQALKHGLDKTRPNGGGLSFPSGHTSASFSGASFLHKRYGLKYGIPAYIAASFVGWSRIEADAHYPRDVAAGALLAIGVNHYFVTPQKKGVMVGLLSDPQSGVVGLSLNGSW
ncbi:MAG: phosphatase PAP2 family protein [Gammaproteobacteria bacterium]|nr:phosphatase PAP2 family protein [Gammaproteobacteria bacterium]